MNEIKLITTDDVRAAIRDELTAFFALHPLISPTEKDEIGRGAQFASQITGKAPATIYDLCHKRQIPHSKRGGNLYFSKRELERWILSGRRMTESEIKELAALV